MQRQQQSMTQSVTLNTKKLSIAQSNLLAERFMKAMNTQDHTVLWIRSYIAGRLISAIHSSPLTIDDAIAIQDRLINLTSNEKAFSIIEFEETPEMFHVSVDPQHLDDYTLAYITNTVPETKAEKLRRLFNFSDSFIWEGRYHSTSKRLHQMVSGIPKSYIDASEVLAFLNVLSQQVEESSIFCLVESRKIEGYYRLLIDLEKITFEKLDMIAEHVQRSLARLTFFLNTLDWPINTMGVWQLINDNTIEFILHHHTEHNRNLVLQNVNGLVKTLIQFCKERSIDLDDLPIDVFCYSNLIDDKILLPTEPNRYQLIINPMLLSLFWLMNQHDLILMPFINHSLTELHKTMVDATISFPLNEVKETMLNNKSLEHCDLHTLYLYRQAIMLCFYHRPPLSKLYKDDFSKVISEIEMLRHMLNHPCPQNKARGNGNAFVQAVLRGNSTAATLTPEQITACETGVYRGQVYYFDGDFGHAQTKIATMPEGIFNLVGHGGASVTKEMVLIHIKNALIQEYNEVQKELLRRQQRLSIMAKDTSQVFATTSMTTLSTTGLLLFNGASNVTTVEQKSQVVADQSLDSSKMISH